LALSHAILASLLHDPKTGYDLAKQFGANGYFWHASHQQIYRELKRLEDDGAVVATADEHGARGDRKRAITSEGRRLLADWAGEPSESATIKEDVLVKCLALGLIDPSVLIDQITRHRAEHDGRRRHHEGLLNDEFASGAPPVGPLLGRFLALQAGVVYERAWVEWADMALASIEKADG
jgi:DNA-binding PadR family transcriptional regulator